MCEVGKHFIFPLNQPQVANQQKKVFYAQYKQTRLLGHGTLISSILFNSFSSQRQEIVQKLDQRSHCTRTFEIDTL